MRLSILIPHYKTGKMTAYCLSQIFKLKGEHEPDVYLVDNSNGEGMDEVFELIDKKGWPVSVLLYPQSLQQSHGIAFDYALKTWYDDITPYFITLETDSFPTNDNWLQYYVDLIEQGYDMAGSKLQLSGGEYIHPAGAMYSKENWSKARVFVKELNKTWDFYPNMLYKEGEYDLAKDPPGFPYHVMKHQKYLVEFNPDTLHHSYKNNTPEHQLNSYLPIAQSVFHNGMGGLQEEFMTYGQRNIETGIRDLTILLNREKIETLVYRMGYEPGQFFAYWHYALGKKVYEIPTEVAWMEGWEGRQQESTITENGIKHLWGVSAYGLSTQESVAEITARKLQRMNELYETII